MPLFLLFVAIPLIEIALFIQVGGAIGLWPTLLIVVLTAILGTTLLRKQGVMALNNLQSRISAFQDPSEPLAHGAMILFAGALLLTPGFFTDALGLALMVPQVRSFAFDRLRSQVTSHANFGFSQTTQNPAEPEDIIDGEFTELDPTQRPTHRPSGWTKH